MLRPSTKEGAGEAVLKLGCFFGSPSRTKFIVRDLRDGIDFYNDRSDRGLFEIDKKAPIRIELMHGGFADRSLTAWVWRRAIKRVHFCVRT